MRDISYVIWASGLSPFALKTRALFQYSGIPYKWHPAEGSLSERLRGLRRVDAIKRGRLPIHSPDVDDDLDELPLVPFVFSDDGTNLCDSSAIAQWCDTQAHRDIEPLFPTGEIEHMAARLIDEYFDEFGLYMAHHNRWVTSAHDNDAGRRLAREMIPVTLAPLRPILASRFSARQVRRLPYLFSNGNPSSQYQGLSPARRPPAIEGFPPTHALLDEAFLKMLERVELVLSDQAYLLGERFTIADASAYGQLAMNLDDPAPCRIIELRAPLTYAWLRRIQAGEHQSTRKASGSARLEVSPRLSYLLEEIRRTFVPLMRQNEAAYEKFYARGVKMFNEAAFGRGVALYDGEIDGRPFRSVAKSFQVKVWRRIKREWSHLSKPNRAKLPDVES